MPIPGAHSNKHTCSMDACPVCGSLFSVNDLQDHVQLHFLEDEPPAPSRARARDNSALQHANGHDVMVIDGSGDGANDERVQCPYGCGAVVLLDELDSHEEAHRLQEMEAHDKEQEAKDFEKLQMKFGFSDKRPGKCYRCGEEGHWSRECPSNPAAQALRNQAPLPTVPSELTRLQQPDPGYRQQPEVDVIPLLQACFEEQPRPNSSVYLSGPVCFYSRSMADSGWGCGYRNIQMQVSHQLLTSQDHRRALFGGRGFVPGIPSLQAWLEVAWQAGFDPGGAAMFGSAVQGTRKWIGTTEAAALLRYFGCRALIFDFYGKSDQAVDSSSGPTIHQNVACDICGKAPITGVRYKSYTTPDFDVCSSCRHTPQAQQHAPFFESGCSGGGGINESAACSAAAAAAGPSRGGTGSTGQQGAGPSASSSGNKRPRQQQRAGADDRRQDNERHRGLAEWIWAYFSTPGLPGAPSSAPSYPPPPPAAARLPPPATAAASRHNGSANAFKAFANGNWQPSHVVLTGKPPLYLQHEGHSRTVIGIERYVQQPPRQQQQQAAAAAAAAGRGQHNGMGARSSSATASGGAFEYSLIVLDPGISQGELLNSLRSRNKWQFRVKRGMFSLARHAELQLLYVAPGVVPEGPERDALKKVAAAERYK